ncbi:hypothetical protein [Sanguibacter sp. 25GB23B1]|uniref:hypothetical protein n=2 Tax=unclassified Sanguibacter TaxID=2645534 RepID=UPI0032AEE85D
MTRETRRGRAAVRPHAVSSALTVALTLTLTACGDGRITPARSSAPDDLDYTEVAGSITDKQMQSTVTINGLVPNFPVPEGVDAPDGVEAYVLVDVTLSTGSEIAATTGPTDFQLQSASGDPLLADPSLEVALTSATFWPLEELTKGQSQRGWVAFPLTWDTLDGAVFVMTRPSEAALDNGLALEAAEFQVPLSADAG